MMTTTVHDTASSSRTPKPTRVAKLTVSTSNEISTSDQSTTLNKKSIKTKTISIPNKPLNSENASVSNSSIPNTTASANFTISKLKKTSSLNSSKKTDYFLNSHKTYFGNRLLPFQSGNNATSDSEDISSKIEVKSENLEETLVPILIVSSKNKLKTKYSDHFDQKARAKFNNPQRVKKKQNKITTAFSNTNININSGSISSSNINKLNEIHLQNGFDQAQVKINHYINQVCCKHNKIIIII